MSAIFVFEIKGAKKEKKINFLKSRFSVMGGPMDIIFGIFSETYVRLLKSIISQFLSKYSKSYNNLNAKNCLKLNDRYKKTGRVRATKLQGTNRTR